MKTAAALSPLILGMVLALGVGPMAFATEAENAAKNIVKDASKGEYDKFQKRLIGGRDSQASRDTYDTIRARTSSYKKVTAVEALVGARYGFRVYNVDVYAEKPRVKSMARQRYVISATVQCAVSRTYSPGYCYGLGPGWRRGWGWGLGDCFPGHSFENERCAVTTLYSDRNDPVM